MPSISQKKALRLVGAAPATPTELHMTEHGPVVAIVPTRDGVYAWIIEENTQRSF